MHSRSLGFIARFLRFSLVPLVGMSLLLVLSIHCPSPS